MFLKLFFALSSLIVSAPVFAFPCYFTLMKDSCWTNYDVKVVVIDADSEKQLVAVEVPKGKTWARESFICQPGQKLMYQATFQPIFWQSDEGKVYKSIRYWLLPASISNNETAWDIPVCYSAAFAEVPLPPTAEGHCSCNFKSIPPIKPQ